MPPSTTAAAANQNQRKASRAAIRQELEARGLLRNFSAVQNSWWRRLSIALVKGNAATILGYTRESEDARAIAREGYHQAVTMADQSAT